MTIIGTFGEYKETTIRVISITVNHGPHEILDKMWADMGIKVIHKPRRKKRSLAK